MSTGQSNGTPHPNQSATDAAWKTFFDAAPFQMGITELTDDEDLILVSLNAAAAASIGLSTGAAQGKRLSELGLPGPRGGIWLDQYLEAWRTRQPVHFEQPSGLPGREQWWAVTLAFLGEGPTGRPRFSYVVEDATGRKQDERTQAALRQISEATQAATLPELFQRIHQIIGELLPARNFFVALYDESKDELSFPYFVDDFDAPFDAQKLDDGTLSGRVIQTGQSLLFTPDTPREGTHEELIVIGTESLDWLGVPLKWKSRTIGALVVQSYTGDIRYTEKDKDLLEFISAQVASAIARKQSEQALLLSESRLEEAQRLAHLGSWNWDLSSQTLNWSDELCRIYGVESGAHLPSFDDFLGRIFPEDRKHVQEIVAQALVDLQPFSHETRILRADGEIRTVFDRGEVLVDENGRATGMAGACLDITVRKMGELLEQERSLVLEAVAQNQPLPGILSSIAQTLEHQRPGLIACLMLVKNGRLYCGGAPSMPATFLEAIERLPVTVQNGSFAATALGGAPVLASDTSIHPSWSSLRHLAQNEHLRSCWSHPVLAAGGDVLGTLSLFGPVPREAVKSDLQLLESASRLAAVAIEHRELTDQLSHQAQHDALTGLPNRLLFQDRLNQALALARRHRQQVAVLYMDLDRFKHINDTLGHSCGDALLRQAAERLNNCIRTSDTLARLGGDEFTVVLTELADSRDVTRIASKLIESMRVPFQVDGRELFVSVSLGISIFPTDALEGEALMVNADVAMYRAKEMGRDNFQWFAPEMNSLARERMDLESELRHALRLGQLSLHYQPQCGPDGEILAFEALMRWQHPTLGMVSPARFIPLAEDSGLIVQLGEWALRQACAQTVAWREAGHPALRISVNVSAVQFKRADWVDTVRQALSETGLAPDALELEITESLLLQSVKETSANLFELRDLGVGVAIDDFGTGYSSLSYLHKLPFTTLKIDQSFVREIGVNAIGGREEAPIIRTIIALARNLGMAVVAEGVETEVQRNLLLRLGCQSLQGNLLHYPADVQRTNVLLETTRSARAKSRLRQ
ncbi:MAG: EAL domain-containing protein [Arenimonas sp.]